MVDQEPLACRADHHRHPLSDVERTEAVRERVECLFCADPVPPGTAEDTEPRFASKVTCRGLEWQGAAALRSGAFALACRPALDHMQRIRSDLYTSCGCVNEVVRCRALRTRRTPDRHCARRSGRCVS